MQNIEKQSAHHIFITQTEAARMFNVAPFSAKWRRMRQQSGFPPLHYMTDDPRERGTFKRSELEAYRDSL